MSRDSSKDAEEQVERAILAAFRQRVDPASSETEDQAAQDEALISAAVAAHLQVVPLESKRKRNNVTPWIAATGLLVAAAAAMALWLVPATPRDEARTVAQAKTNAPTQAMWVLERDGTPLEGVAAAVDHELCGTRARARACLGRGSRGAFESNGNLQLHDGSARVEAQGPIVLSLAGVQVQATTDAANFSATRRARAWTVSVESGTATVTGPDGASQVLEAGESAGSEPAELAVPVDSAQAAEPVGEPKQDEPGIETTPGESQKPTPSADELLKLARSQRAAKEFAAAAQTCEQLVRAYPNSTKVRATLVSLAQLYQGPLDDPAKALRHFDRYLEQGGLLAEEAHYGKIRALRALGRSAAADTELDAFLRTYPDSAHADALRGN